VPAVEGGAANDAGTYFRISRQLGGDVAQTGRSRAAGSCAAANKCRGMGHHQRGGPEADRAGVVAGFREAGAAGEAIAAIVEERGRALK
jgi:hypothetical protein